MGNQEKNLGEEKLKDDLPYSLALKAESNLIGKESLQFGFSVKKSMKQCLYIGENKGVETSGVKFQKDTIPSKMPTTIHHGEENLQKINDIQMESMTGKRKGVLASRDVIENSSLSEDNYKNGRFDGDSKSTKHNENHKLECLWIGESLGKKKGQKSRFINGFDVEVESSRGGFSLTWKGDVIVTIISYSKNHIDVQIKENQVDREWCFMRFYEHLLLLK
ncbi:hypothetical protein Goklo_023999, partial [Gossypium klotzschianum]|nr:hypothetical protein [Gossypium klotzschianum]